MWVLGALPAGAQLWGHSFQKVMLFSIMFSWTTVDIYTVEDKNVSPPCKNAIYFQILRKCNLTDI